MNNQNCYLQLKRDGKLNETDASKGNIYSLIRLMQSKPHEQKAFWPKIWLKNETKIKIMKKVVTTTRKPCEKYSAKLTEKERKTN